MKTWETQYKASTSSLAGCSAPSHNSFCVALDRIREERDDIAEDQIAKQPWNTLKPDQMPSCIAESGGFMSPQQWTKVINHPYQANKKTESIHVHKPTPVTIPWMPGASELHIWHRAGLRRLEAVAYSKGSSYSKY